MNQIGRVESYQSFLKQKNAIPHICQKKNVYLLKNKVKKTQLMKQITLLSSLPHFGDIFTIWTLNIK